MNRGISLGRAGFGFLKIEHLTTTDAICVRWQCIRRFACPPTGVDPVGDRRLTWVCLLLRYNYILELLVCFIVSCCCCLLHMYESNRNSTKKPTKLPFFVFVLRVEL